MAIFFVTNFFLFHRLEKERAQRLERNKEAPLISNLFILIYVRRGTSLFFFLDEKRTKKSRLLLNH